MPAFFKWREPRTYIVLLSILGAAFLAYVTIAASIPQGGAMSGYAIGEMSDFRRALPPRAAPYETAAGPDGPVSIRDHEGKVVIVNVWATWCAPCVEELPSLLALAEMMPERGFAFVPITVDTSREKADDFLARHALGEVPVNLDPRFALARSLGAADAIPTTILYDARGREIGRLVGNADWSSPEAIRLVRAAVDGAL